MNGRPIVSRRFPYLPVHVVVANVVVDFEALLDTGFDGDLIIPMDLLTSLPPEHFNARWTLADGASIETPMFNGRVQIASLEPFRARICVLGDEPIIGLGIISRFRLVLDHGQEVIVER